MYRATVLLILLPLLTGAALAHSGVTNPKVMPRMHLMTDIKDTVAGLGAFAKGTQRFDADEAARLVDALAAQAAGVAAAFEDAAQDPKSEARPEIWSDWTGFTAEASKLEAAAQTMQTESRAEVQFGMRALAKACYSCHEDYRLEN
jgi:cytochrome c556